MASPVKMDVVAFIGVLKSYPPGEKLEVSYALQADSDLKPASRDWVGLFRVGWASSRDYYTFEWVTPLNEDMKGAVIFAGRRLPPEDKHFYQFCYVSSDGRVRGASSPFQFSSAPAIAASIDDLELVEISEDSLMILQPKEKKEEAEADEKEQKECEKVENEVSENGNEPEGLGNQPKENGNDPAMEVETNEESLAWKFEMVEREVVQKTELLDEMEKKVSDMERQLQVQCVCESGVCVGVVKQCG